MTKINENFILSAKDIKKIIEIMFDKNYSRIKSNLKEITFDQNSKTSLINTNNECINFDKAANLLTENNCSSVDGIYFNEKDNIIYFIESKNSEIGTLNSLKNDIIRKCIHSALLYYFIISNFCLKNEINVDIGASNIEFILVYRYRDTRFVIANQILDKLKNNKDITSAPNINSINRMNLILENKKFYKKHYFYDNYNKKLYEKLNIAFAK